MKFRALLSALLLAAGIVFVADGAELKKVDSPSQVLKEFFAAMRELDFSKIALLSEGERRTEALQMNAELKRLKLDAQSSDEKVKADAQAKLAFVQQTLNDLKDGLQKMKIKIEDEKIEGDLAEVEAALSGTVDGKIVVRKSYFKKVGDHWKLISQKDYEAEKKKASKK